MHINELDLNLLRLFDAVMKSGSVSRAADLLDMTQPAASQGLTRLRLLLKDPLFVRAPGGVKPSPRAVQLAVPVRQALAVLEVALNESAVFVPAEARRTFHLHMSDIGESRFLPELMAALRQQAPHVRVDTRPLAPEQITEALDSGRIDFAFGFLPGVRDTRQQHLLTDHYIVLLRADHPFAGRLPPVVEPVPAPMPVRRATLADLRQLDYVAVRTHPDTLRILQQWGVQDRVRLGTEHFMVLPSIVRATDLGVVMPRSIAQGFARDGAYVIIEPPPPANELKVALHWSHRFEADPGHQWLRERVVSLFRE